MSKPKQIKPIDGFANVTDGDLVSRATSIQRGMKGKHQFPKSAGGSDGAEDGERHPVKDVGAQLLIKATDLTLLIQWGEVDVTGSGKTLRAVVHYKADTSMPIINQPIYQMAFKHDLAAH